MTASSNRPTREKIALREAGQTAITANAARCMVAVFCLTLLTIPVTQCVLDLNATGTWPQCVGIFKQIPAALRQGTEQPGGLMRKVFAGNRFLIQEMERYETTLEDESFLTRTFYAPVQTFLTRWLSAGNEQAYPGRGKWLFYRPDVDYVTRPAFNIAGPGGPLPAILDFRDQLAARGISLLLIPTPVKPVVLPGTFSPRYPAASPPVHNAAYASFLDQLKNHGIAFIDPTQMLSTSAVPLYLETDTHWTFDGMDRVARAAADVLTDMLDLEPGPMAYQRLSITVTNEGDIVTMLKLPADSALYPDQVQVLQQILTANNELWKPKPSADILLLGDSFSNIYSLDGMGWGASAGVAEQMSYYLQRPLDTVLQNDQGSIATRRKLSNDLARGRDRLAGKQAVVWQFAVRELADGQWTPLPLQLGEARASSFFMPEAGVRTSCTGVVASVSLSPKPGTVPYRDNLITLHVVDLAIPGVASPQEALVYAWGMRGNRLVPAAFLRPGDRISLELFPWFEVEETYSSFRRSLLDTYELELEEPCWANTIIRLPQ